MELWLQMGSVEVPDLVPVALAAEAAGIAGLSMSDHLVHPGLLESSYPYTDDGSIVWGAQAPWPDSWVAIGAMGAATHRIQLSTGVFVGPLREPIALAKAISTAAILSGDRVICGLGVGWMREEFDAIGEEFSNRGQRLDELTTILRALWTGAMVEHHGPHYAFEAVQMLPAPAAPIPIWIGGNTPVAMRRAARQDGWICSYHDVDQSVDGLRQVQALSRELGDRQAPLRTAVVGRIRNPTVLNSLATAGFDAVIVPLAALTRGRDLDSWLQAIEAAARLRDQVGAA
jgi:probable F420-dependent oxidoreductase